MIVLRRLNWKVDQRSTFSSRSAVGGEAAINQSTGHVRGRGRARLCLLFSVTFSHRKVWFKRNAFADYFCDGTLVFTTVSKINRKQAKSPLVAGENKRTCSFVFSVKRMRCCIDWSLAVEQIVSKCTIKLLFSLQRRRFWISKDSSKL